MSSNMKNVIAKYKGESREAADADDVEVVRPEDDWDEMANMVRACMKGQVKTVFQFVVNGEEFGFVWSRKRLSKDEMEEAFLDLMGYDPDYEVDLDLEEIR